MSRLGITSLRGRLITLVAISVIPALALVVYTGLEQRQATRTVAQNDAFQIARTAARAHRHLIEQTQQLLTVLAELPQLRADLPGEGECGRLLANILKQHRRYANFGVTDMHGVLKCSAVPFTGRVDLSDRSYFKRALARKNFALGEYIVGRVTGKPSLPLAYPILDSHGEGKGVVYAAVNLAWLEQLATSSDLPIGSTLTLIDTNNTILIRHPHGNKWIGRVMPDGPLLDALKSSREGVLEALGMDDIPRIYSFTSLQSDDRSGAVHLSVGIPSAVAYHGAESILLRNLLALLLVASLTFAAAWFGGHVFVLRQVNNLLHAVRRFAAGDMNTRTGLGSRQGELNELGHAFDEMAAALQRRTTELDAEKCKIARLNRVYAVLSGINGAIMRIRERDALFREACRISVELGEFRLAWIGVADPTAHAIKPFCHAGDEQGYLDLIRIGHSRQENENTPGNQLFAGRTVLCHDIAADPRPEFARDAALERGYRSCVMLPLRVSDHVVGTLNLYAAEPNFFDGDELRLLEELAADTSLGLEYIAKEEALHAVSYYDVLTGIPNRVLFADRLDQTLAREQFQTRPVGLMMAHIERIKEINTIHGHYVGDQLLKQMAAYLMELVRAGDTVARTGSAAFGIILTDLARPADAALVAQQLVDRFRDPLVIDEKEIFVHLHIGIAVAPEDGRNAETILRHADAALHRLEGHSASAYRFYTPEINAHAVQRLDIERELRHAIERGELELHYQPIVDLASLNTVGCEALLRWRNAKLGEVPPARFIPIAEQTDLIVPIGEWVIKTACLQATQWLAEGWATRVAINTSAVQLRQPDFAERVNLLLNEANFNTGKPPLALELTESQLMENAEQSSEILTTLRDHGLLIFIDDFGTGYSSLSYLRSLPIDTLKIDMSFVRDITHNANDAAIVKAIIALGQSLGKNVIAEGVETIEQLRMLRDLGCRAAQGFLFSPAVPADELWRLAQQPFPQPTN